MNKKYLYILCCLAAAIFQGCITEYHADVDEISSLLVVEGSITEDTTVIKLSKSVGLSDSIQNIQKINHAQVYVESEGGYTFRPLTKVVDGTYKIPVSSLDPNSRYRLKIKMDGNEYESDYRSPLITPEIDSINIKKEANGLPVTAHVSTHDPNNQSSYYIWKFSEIWEIRSLIYATIFRDENGNIREYDGHVYYNFGYYCWQYNNSNSLLLGSTNTATENRIIEHKLFEQPATDLRFSQVYYLEVQQNMIRKDAYDYFNNIQQNIESIGSIFGPIPSEMKGNIVCVNKPDEPVIGFIDVSTTTRATRFFLRSDIYEFPYPLEYCMTENQPPNVQYNEDFLPYEYNNDKGIAYALAICVDCRRAGGTKNKPIFWPNDHK